MVLDPVRANKESSAASCRVCFEAFLDGEKTTEIAIAIATATVTASGTCDANGLSDTREFILCNNSV